MRWCNAAPAEALNGVLRLTEQGEALQQSYGLRPIAMRTLERAFNALSHADRGGSARQGHRRIAREHLECARDHRRLPAARRIARSCTASAEFYALLPRGHADRRHRADADRLAPGASRHRSRALDIAARRALGVRVDAVAAHAAGLVSARAAGLQAAIAAATASRASARGVCELVLPAQSHRRRRGHAGARRSRDRRRLRHAGARARCGTSSSEIRREYALAREQIAGDQGRRVAARYGSHACSGRSSCAIPTSIR